MTPMTILSKFVIDVVRKYDMQVDIHNAEAKEEENDDNDVGNSSDFVILKNFSQGEKNK